MGLSEVREDESSLPEGFDQLEKNEWKKVLGLGFQPMTKTCKIRLNIRHLGLNAMLACHMILFIPRLKGYCHHLMLLA